MQNQSNKSAGLTRAERIRLHLLCPWRTIAEARFHLAGIMRELGVRFPAA